MLSIDVGNKNLHLVEGRYSEGKIDITTGLVAAIPPEVLSEHIFENADALAQFTRKLLQVNKIKSRDVVLTINTGNTIIRDFELPNASPREIAAMVKNEMEQVSMVSEGSIIDYRLLPSDTNNSATKDNNLKDNKIKVRAGSIRKSIVVNAIRFVEGMKLKPKSLDVHFNSICKLFKSGTEINGSKYGEENPALLVDFGNTSTNLYILSDKGIELARTIHTGGKHINGAYNEKSNAETTSNVTDSNKDSLNRWTDELYKVVQYYNTRSSLSTIRTVFLFGGDSSEEGLTEYISNLFSMNCEVIKSIDRVRISKKAEDIPLNMLINAVGAMIQS